LISIGQVGNSLAAGLDGTDQPIHEFGTGVAARKVTFVGHHQVRLDQRASLGMYASLIHPFEQNIFDLLRIIRIAMF